MLMVQCKAVAEEKARVLTHGLVTVLRAALPVVRGGQLCGDDREMLVHPSAALS